MKMYWISVFPDYCITDNKFCNTNWLPFHFFYDREVGMISNIAILILMNTYTDDCWLMTSDEVKFWLDLLSFQKTINSHRWKRAMKNCKVRFLIHTGLCVLCIIIHIEIHLQWLWLTIRLIRYCFRDVIVLE